MLTKALKWGNSLAVRIPSVLSKECGIEENTNIEIVRRDGEIIITPARKGCSLDKPLAGVTKNNIHSEFDTLKSRLEIIRKLAVLFFRPKSQGKIYRICRWDWLVYKKE